MTLSLVLAESALELVPQGLRHHPSVRSDAGRRQVDPSGILLDRSIHHAAMMRLKDGPKRGRPDLVHLTLLSVTSTPLYQEGGLRVLIHTAGDVVLELGAKTRPPKSYLRFRNLMEKLLLEWPSEGLVTVYSATVAELLRRLRPALTVGLSVQGETLELTELAKELTAENSAVLIGGFPRGHFLPSTLKAMDRLVRIDQRPLDAHVAAARLIYEVEKRLNRLHDG